MADGDRSRWDARWGAPDAPDGAPARALVEVADLLPVAAPDGASRALDVAGGAGRNAVWLAARSFDVTLVDVSPVALARAAGTAARAGVTLRLVEADLDAAPLPAGPWDAIVVVDFLHRPLFDVIPTALAPGGVLVYAQPTRRNLERHAQPSARVLVEPGELRTLARGLDVVRYVEDWLDDRHVARLVARRR